MLNAPSFFFCKKCPEKRSIFVSFIDGILWKVLTSSALFIERYIF